MNLAAGNSSAPPSRIPVIKSSGANQVLAPRGRVLVVDDEPISRLVVRRILQIAGFEALEAENGSKALEIFSADPSSIDAVVLDFMMPGLTGDKTFRAMRRLRRSVPVLLVSGLQPTEVLPKFEGAAFISYLKKPVLPVFLVQAIEELLDAAGSKKSS